MPLCAAIFVTTVTYVTAIQMAQHFLLSAAARTLKLKDVYRMSDDQAFQAFAAIRFAENGGAPFCPECGCTDPYFITTRRKWKCRACGKGFSATSGTIFASRKMAFVDLLAAICIWVNAAKGISALQLSRDLDCQYKTAFVLAHKLREAMALGNDGVTLGGVVEIDGAYFGGHVRPENRKEDRRDRRLSANRDADRRVVVVLREREGRTLPFVVRREAEGVAIARRRVALGAVLHADEGPHWDALEAHYRAHRINHSQAYSWDDACTNQAESVARSSASTTTSRISISISMRTRRRGAKITAGRTTRPSTSPCSPLRSHRRSAASGRGIGSGRRDLFHHDHDRATLHAKSEHIQNLESLVEKKRLAATCGRGVTALHAEVCVKGTLPRRWRARQAVLQRNTTESGAQDIICEAIQGKQLLSFMYENRLRTVEPHLLGYDHSGDLTLSAWQMSGGSGRDWRDFHVSKLSSLAIAQGRSEVPRPGYNPRSEKMARVICCIRI